MKNKKTKNLINYSKSFNISKVTPIYSDVISTKPVFAFEYISLDNNNLSFNSKLINSSKDYVKLFERLKIMSEKTYDELAKDKFYRFHKVDFDSKDVKVPFSSFMKCLDNKVGQDITVYQFEAFEEVRIFGFLDYRNVFYLVWFDRNHLVYKRRDK